MGLITWAEYCAFDGLDPAETTDKTRLQGLIDAASAAIEKYCGRKFAPGSYSKADLWRSRIILDALPATSVRIYIDPLGLFAADTEWTTGFWVDGPSGIVMFQSGHVWTETPCKVTWTGGMTSLPDDLKEAVYKTVKWDKARIFSQQVGIKSQVSGDVTTTFDTAIPYEVRQTLDNYRLA